MTEIPQHTRIVARWSFRLTSRHCMLLNRMVRNPDEVNVNNDQDVIMDLLRSMAEQWAPVMYDESPEASP